MSSVGGGSHAWVRGTERAELRLRVGQRRKPSSTGPVDARAGCRLAEAEGLGHAGRVVRNLAGSTQIVVSVIVSALLAHVDSPGPR